MKDIEKHNVTYKKCRSEMKHHTHSWIVSLIGRTTAYILKRAKRGMAKRRKDCVDIVVEEGWWRKQTIIVLLHKEKK